MSVPHLPTIAVAAPTAPPLSALGERWPRWRPWLLGACGLLLAVAIGLTLRRLLGEVRYDDVMATIDATPTAGIAAAVLATAVSYLALTQYDASALRYVGITSVARSTVLLTSFVAYALSNTIGLGPLSGGAVRMRLYAAAGLEPPQIARLIVFNTAAFGVGMLVFGSLGLLWGAGEVAPLLHARAGPLRAAAAAVLIGVAGFLYLCATRRVLQFDPWAARAGHANVATAGAAAAGTTADRAAAGVASAATAAVGPAANGPVATGSAVVGAPTARGAALPAAGSLAAALAAGGTAAVPFAATGSERRRRDIIGMRLPPFGLALRQLVISAFELAASAAALWFLLPANHIPLPTFIAFYAIAIAAGIASHVPGGLGVFEAVMLLATGTSGAAVPSHAMLGALLLYRGIYYVLPLVLATGALIAYELRSGVAAPVGRMAVHLSPRLMAALTVVAGLWLMVSGVTPFTTDAREVLATLHVPLPLIEAAHFLASVAGLGLLLVARGLLHQLDAAWWAALAMSIVAAVLALPKGIAVHEAAMLSTLALLLVISRHQFDRRSSLFEQRLEPEWLLALGGLVAACVWVLFFAYQEVGYSNQLWWQFELDGQAPRSLRALLAVALIALAFGLWQLLRPPAGELARTSAVDIERAAAIVRANPSSDACYALIGDKQLLFSPSGRSFLMFGKHGRTWVSLYGPFGEPREWPDLVWQFIELATDHGGRAAFYQVRPAALPLYLDCGLDALKLGEYAHVTLPDFSLKGAKRANLRSGVNRGEREGLTFEVLPPGAVAPLLPALREVSDAWLAGQRGREKSFSVGRFDAGYLQLLPLAVVRREGRVIAFANLLMTDARQEASVDLMRHLPEAPPGTMDFLFAKILLHLQAQGYERFGLGMSPMSGMAERRRAPRWQRLGRLLFQYGDRFYNFRGLHNFKNKFEPVWEARYLAAPGGLSPVFVLADVASLIGGGVKGVVAK